LSAQLTRTFDALSPRLNPPRRALRGTAIWGAAVALFIALFAQGFIRTGAGAWAVGIVYIIYDTALLLFVARQTRVLSPLPGREGPGVGAERSEDGAASSPSAIPTPSPSLSGRGKMGVIVAAYNEATVLQATIEALRAQDVPPDMIVIADDGSDDNSAAVLGSAYKLTSPALGAISIASPVDPTLHWLRLPRGGKAKALNTAIGLLDCDVLVTVDADTLLEPGALSAMREAFAREPQLAAATGVLRPLCPPTVSGRLFQWFQTYEYVRNFLSRYAWMEKHSLLLISGAFAGFRRDALIRIGGFDPECLVEDYEVMHRLHRYGVDHDLDWEVRVIGNAFATTDSPATLMTFLRQRRRWFAGFLQTQLWNRDMIGNPKYGALGTAMLPVKALDTVQPLYGLAAFGLLIAFIVVGLRTGNFNIVWPVLIAMLVKVVIDLAWLLRSLVLYRRWTGHGEGMSAGGALLAAVLEPVSFQLLRHAGAAWGWWVFLTGRQVWGANARVAKG
jgi:cellulose synthase/poly-beta-1,6-N-acetylglucosamine synthase-like glycosyltransferase